MSGGGGGDDPRPRPVRPIGVRNGGGDVGGTGTGAGGGGMGGGGAPDPCDLTEQTNVNSVDRKVLATLQIGSVLSVVKNAGPPVRLLVQTSAGATLGSITSPSLAQILSCIDAGHRYQAEIRSISGGAVQVSIERR